MNGFDQMQCCQLLSKFAKSRSSEVLLSLGKSSNGQFLNKLETLPKSAKRMGFCICHHILEKKSSSYNRKPHFAQLLDDFLMNGSLRRIFGQFFINNTTARRNDDDEDHLFPRPLLSPFGLFPKEKIVVNYWPQTCSVANLPTCFKMS